ncbi:YifB family Mg chelatase-like AAA ATPase [Demequina sp. NBRC 110055]|uniref:YifB family Mg chelatase-like AAA ATPase n=1 Tax=Demequina sp. NBRC 110055 TaxID=1570344 RepID=UPI0009FC6717|nr:YifB family Mg chelatase-like AAA ATPase [Demequina sp. NBRC 110055]
MIGRARGVVLAGLAGHVIEVEAHVAPGLPSFTLVGLPDTALSEARERVRAAVASSRLTWPARRVTVSLSPASLPKSGAGTDLAIAVAVLAAAGLIRADAGMSAVHLGELGLDGRVRAVRGVLPAVAAAAKAGARVVVVPDECVAEAALVPGVEVRGVRSLAQLLAAYGNSDAHELAALATQAPLAPEPGSASPDVMADLADVRGQAEARAALEVAAAGGHHLLMTGPPGVGKSMLATRLPGLLPDLSPADAVEVTSVHSLAGTFDPSVGLLTRPPFEAPHHSASAAAIVGGGAALARPGAISRAHAGVLFLDEAPEFPTRVLQTLRQPLERGEVVLHRALGATRYPARFQLVMAANPCPCGKYYGPHPECTCTPHVRRTYLHRLSGPLLDRVDLHVDVRPVRRVDDGPAESTAVVAARVAQARERARARLAEHGWGSNAQAHGRWLRDHTPRAACTDLWRALDHGVVSVRGADRTLRVAWTLADLAGEPAPDAAHVAQALALRTRELA